VKEARNSLAKQLLILLASLLSATECIFQVLGVARSLYCLLTWSAVNHKHVEATHHRLNAVGLLLQAYILAFSNYFTVKLDLNDYLLILFSSLLFVLCLLYIAGA